MSLRDTCLELDSVLLNYMDTLGQIYSLQRKLESTMNDGYLLMSKARYSMGNKAVGALQYNMEDMNTAHMHIDTVKDGEDVTFHITSEISSNMSKSKDSNLRQRSKVDKPNIEDFADLTEAVEELKMSDMKETKGSQLKDPIKWFGVLVPQALRQSQAKFKQVVELSVDLANLEQRSIRLSEKYRKLLAEKKMLLTDLPENDDDDDDCVGLEDDYDFAEGCEEGNDSENCSASEGKLEENVENITADNKDKEQ